MKPTYNEYKRHIELISDIPTEDIINAAWDCNMIEPCYKCKHHNVCNKHDTGASAIGLAILRLIELNERVKELEDASIERRIPAVESKNEKRLTEKCWRNLDDWECCGQDAYCKRDSFAPGGCHNGCRVPQIYYKLAKYEDILYDSDGSERISLDRLEEICKELK
jgi:hypothetical protein